MKKLCLVYALHSGNLYGTEQMALMTLLGLRDDYTPILLAPSGALVAEAKRLGIPLFIFDSTASLAKQVQQILAQHHEIIFISTSIRHVLFAWLWNGFYRRKLVQIHAVHGGTDERNSYQRKHWLGKLGIHLIANSHYTRSRLLHYGTRSRDVTVIENFLLASDKPRPQRHAYTETKRRNVIIVSRLDPIKRLDLLLDALEQTPQLHDFQFRVFGTGSEMPQLIARAQAQHPNVQFMGFNPNIYAELAKSDIFLHLCPTEPFGLAILEAMAVGVVALVPDSGGAGSIIDDNNSGVHFVANNLSDLSQKLIWLGNEASSTQLNQLVSVAKQQLNTRFSPHHSISAYRQLLEQQCQIT